MMKRVLCLVGLCFACGFSLADDPKPVAKEAEEINSKPTSFWMERKLEYSQAILRNLALSDFEAIQKDAKSMALLNRVEGFVRRKNPEYRNQVKIFTRVSEAIAKQAERENIEGVAYGFNRLTVSCVECHQLMRATEKDDTLATQ